MPKALDLTNQKFGRLTALYRDGHNKKGEVLWQCKCDCGNLVKVVAYRLKNGHTQSCGCYRRDQMIKAITKHGDSKRKLHTELYQRWRAMISRCTRPKFIEYENYGGRGIKVCDEWLLSYENFKRWAFGNGFIEGKRLTLDRIDNNSDYCPSNCRWVNQKIQNNNKRSNHRVSFRGKMLTIAQVSDETGIAYHTIKSRIYRGWKDEQLALPTKRK